MDCKNVENEMFSLIREHSKHVEMWWPIKGFDNYQVSTKGRVRNVITRNILKGRKSDGYYQVELTTNDNKRKHMRVHRLVGLAFIPNLENKPFIDHIDHNRTNNNLINLRWVTNSENQMNKGKQSNNTSGTTGIHYDECCEQWSARVQKNGIRHEIGHFDTLEDAKEARNKFVKELFKEFTNVEVLK